MTAKLRVLAFLLALPACATSTGGSAELDTSGAAASPRHGGYDPITLAELEDPHVIAGSTLDAIRRLRPLFLSSRGAGGLDPSANAVLVSVDGSALATLSTLSTIPADQVGEIRFLSATDAAQRFGTRGVAGPVILVSTRRK